MSPATVLSVVVLAAQPPMRIADPAPPRVRPLPLPAPVVRERPHPRVEVMGSARPVPPGAITRDWPCFLGPTHDGVCAETRLRKRFAPRGGPAGPGRVWQLAVGAGYAAPAVVGERIVVFHRLGNEEVVECLHAERGTRFWERRYPTTYRDRFGYNNGPRATPAVAGGRVYTCGAQGTLHCLDLRTGHVFWKRDLQRELDLRTSFFGVGSSPLVEGGRVIVNVGAREGPAVAAFDAKTGRLAWGAETDWGAGYASPVPATIHGRRVVFVFAGGRSSPPTGGLLCLDPRTGATYFRVPWRSRRIASVNASSPVVVGDTVFASSIYKLGRSGILLRVGPGLTHSTVATTRYGSHWMTPIVRDGHLYGFADSSLVCTDFRTGKEAWRVRTPFGEAQEEDPTQPRSKLGRAGLLWADGAFLCLGEYGDLCWLAMTPKGMKVLSHAKLFHAPQTWTGPVVSRGLLYVRQNEPDRTTRRPRRLLCYDLRGGP